MSGAAASDLVVKPLSVHVIVLESQTPMGPIHVCHRDFRTTSLLLFIAHAFGQMLDDLRSGDPSHTLSIEYL